jgi:hypothetical protein
MISIYVDDGAPYSVQETSQISLTILKKNGSVGWPAWSPDLNPCIFLLLEHIKQCTSPVDTGEELTCCVTQLAETIRDIQL